jgi:hypothetical protein
VQDVAVMHRGLEATPTGYVHVVKHLWLMNSLAGSDKSRKIFMMRRVYIGHEGC